YAEPVRDRLLPAAVQIIDAGVVGVHRVTEPADRPTREDRRLQPPAHLPRHRLLRRHHRLLQQPGDPLLRPPVSTVDLATEPLHIPGDRRDTVGVAPDRLRRHGIARELSRHLRPSLLFPGLRRLCRVFLPPGVKPREVAKTRMDTHSLATVPEPVATPSQAVT